MKALSIRAPWWWYILHGGKDIENRDWETRMRGRVLVHASAGWHWGEMLEAVTFANAVSTAKGKPTTTLAPLRPFGGHIVGSVEIVGCVSRSDSPWFFGRYGFQLANPIAFATPIPCKGALGFFDVPADVLAQLPRE